MILRCPECGCDRDDHHPIDIEDGTDERNYMRDPYTCGDCCDCNETFDPGDQIEAVMRAAESQRGLR